MIGFYHSICIYLFYDFILCSPLYNTRVILRQLYSTQAQRRGKRAIEVCVDLAISEFNFVHVFSSQFFVGVFKVLKKLVRRKLLYHSYSMQVLGYISLPASGGSGSFILVHGVGLNLNNFHCFNSFIYI